MVCKICGLLWKQIKSPQYGIVATLFFWFRARAKQTVKLKRSKSWILFINLIGCVPEFFSSHFFHTQCDQIKLGSETLYFRNKHISINRQIIQNDDAIVCRSIANILHKKMSYLELYWFYSFIIFNVLKYALSFQTIKKLK